MTLIARAWRWHVIVAAALPWGAGAQQYTAMPAAPRSAPANADTVYYLTLSVNGRRDGEVLPVRYSNGRFSVEASALASRHVRLDGLPERGWIELDRLPEVQVRYDAAAQVLHLTVPLQWLPMQLIEGSRGMPSSYMPATSDSGLLLNYDAYYTDANRGASTLSTWLEQRAFGGWGVFANTGVHRQVFNRGVDVYGRREGYTRYDTHWRYSDQERQISYQVGDFVSDSLNWSHSVRMGGLRISRNFEVRPDLVTYPIIQFSGSAAVPSSVDLFINGNRASSSSAINSGPFTLTNVPYLNGAGEATVVTTDALGRQVSTSIPFYVSNRLLRKGLSDFDLSLGVLRRDYGLSDFHYARGAFSGIYRYGLSDSLTLSGHGEASSGLALGGLGTDWTPGVWGTLSNALSVSQSGGDHGRQYLLGYTYQSREFGFGVQRMGRSAHYQDLSSVDGLFQLSRRSTQATFSTTPFDRGNGSLGLGYFDIRAADGSLTRLLNVSFSRPLPANSNLMISLGKTVGGSGYRAQVLLTVALGERMMASASVYRDTTGHTTQRLAASRSTPSDGGWGWNLGYATDGGYRQAALKWRADSALVQGGVYGSGGSYNRWGNLSGSLLYMDGGTFAANKVSDSFLLVSTSGREGVPVRYENRAIGTSNGSGHVLIPWATSYHPGKVEIGTLELPLNVEAPLVEQRVAVREGSGTLVKFQLRTVISALISLVDAQGKPLPVGTRVSETHSGQSSVVGYGGQVYFTNLQPDNQLEVYMENGEFCRHSFTLPPDVDALPRIGPLTCPATAVATGEPS